MSRTDAPMSRVQRSRLGGPYEAAIVPRIAEEPMDLPPAALTLAAEASEAIARFDADLGAEVGPFAAVLPRSESASSSQIENLTSGAKQIALAELGESTTSNAREIVGNVHAMRAALSMSGELDAAAILDMHRALLQASWPGIAGRWRSQQVWIGGSAFARHELPS